MTNFNITSTNYVLTPFNLFVSAAVLVLFLITIIAKWKMFNKFGEKGWKSLIPFYNEYVMLKNVWRGSIFFVSLALFILTFTFQQIAASLVGVPQLICLLVGLVFSIALLVVKIRSISHLSRAFGHGMGMTVFGVLFTDLQTIFLGLGNSQYIGAAA